MSATPPAPAPAPLSIVALAVPDKFIATLPHALSLISCYLDCSVNIPLHQACATGSLALLDRIWCHSQLLRAEGSRWCPAASLQTNRHYKRWQFSQSLIQAIRRRDLALIDWIFRHFTRCATHVEVWLVESGLESEVEETFTEACGEGLLPVVWWLADYINTNGIDLDEDTTQSAVEAAAGNGRLEVVKWLIERDLGKGTTWAIHAAAAGGHLEVVKYLHAQGFIGCNQDTLARAAKEGHLPAVQWLWTQFKDDPKADLLCGQGLGRFVSWAPPLKIEMADAAVNGHLEVIQYLHTIVLTLVGKKRKRGESSVHPCEIEMDDVVAEAARNGHLDVVQWVCAHATVKTVKDAMACAAGNGHFPVVKWLHENHPHEDFRTEVMDEAARCGDLSLLKWLHTNRPDEGWSTFAIDNAARGGHLHILRWLLDNDLLYEDYGCYMTSSAMKLALVGNHFDALLFVHYEFKDWSSNPTLEGNDFYNEHMEVWLQEELGDSSEAN